ncbi:hypothetical protein FVE85_2080 [Porphyridium purpureum]|uniref:Uncharacterized protein n=1 Tax=Porphyridium purpureum TaxID=35688 RepID=A0A5J4YXN9_PORPP|nr:hypothetical protein FVE85_2080 [Porphyridium purpureum]|eukprot:POR6432..scf209_3
MKSFWYAMATNPEHAAVAEPETPVASASPNVPGEPETPREEEDSRGSRGFQNQSMASFGSVAFRRIPDRGYGEEDDHDDAQNAPSGSDDDGIDDMDQSIPVMTTRTSIRAEVGTLVPRNKVPPAPLEHLVASEGVTVTEKSLSPALKASTLAVQSPTSPGTLKPLSPTSSTASNSHKHQKPADTIEFPGYWKELTPEERAEAEALKAAQIAKEEHERALAARSHTSASQRLVHLLSPKTNSSHEGGDSRRRSHEYNLASPKSPKSPKSPYKTMATSPNSQQTMRAEAGSFADSASSTAGTGNAPDALARDASKQKPSTRPPMFARLRSTSKEPAASGAASNPSGRAKQILTLPRVFGTAGFFASGDEHGDGTGSSFSIEKDQVSASFETDQDTQESDVRRGNSEGTSVLSARSASMTPHRRMALFSPFSKRRARSASLDNETIFENDEPSAGGASVVDGNGHPREEASDENKESVAYDRGNSGEPVSSGDIVAPGRKIEFELVPNRSITEKTDKSLEGSELSSLEVHAHDQKIFGVGSGRSNTEKSSGGWGLLDLRQLSTANRSNTFKSSDQQQPPMSIHGIKRLDAKDRYSFECKLRASTAALRTETLLLKWNYRFRRSRAGIVVRIKEEEPPRRPANVVFSFVTVEQDDEYSRVQCTLARNYFGKFHPGDFKEFFRQFAKRFRDENPDAVSDRPVPTLRETLKSGKASGTPKANESELPLQIPMADTAVSQAERNAAIAASFDPEKIRGKAPVSQLRPASGSNRGGVAPKINPPKYYANLSRGVSKEGTGVGAKPPLQAGTRGTATASEALASADDVTAVDTEPTVVENVPGQEEIREGAERPDNEKDDTLWETPGNEDMAATDTAVRSSGSFVSATHQDLAEDPANALTMDEECVAPENEPRSGGLGMETTPTLPANDEEHAAHLERGDVGTVEANETDALVREFQRGAMNLDPALGESVGLEDQRQNAELLAARDDTDPSYASEEVVEGGTMEPELEGSQADDFGSQSESAGSSSPVDLSGAVRSEEKSASAMSAEPPL